MRANGFAFFRGTAALMAEDLARGPSSAFGVVACGDAHVDNFGLYASPERSLVFDLNDFDEATTAPFEWDVKRLVTSAIIAARHHGFAESEAQAAGLSCATAYRTGLGRLMNLTALTRYYLRAEVQQSRTVIAARYRSGLDRAVKQARRRTTEQALEKMTVKVDGEGRRFVDDPPVTSRLANAERDEFTELFERYRSTVAPDVALLLSQYELTDVALRVVGVGSVGTRCFVLLLTGQRGESLILQVKEAETSVLERWGGMAPTDGTQGARVVASQKILQAVSDPFLGHLRGAGREYYVRQFRDMKASIDVSRLGPDEFAFFVSKCAGVLARAHSQSPAAAAITGYLGNSDNFDRAILAWSLSYAAQSRADFEVFDADQSGARDQG